MKIATQIIMIIALVALLGCSTAREKAKDWLDQQLGKNEPPPPPTQPTENEPTSPPAQPTESDEILYQSLRWNRGGENFSAAVRDLSVSITSVKIVGSGRPTLKYSGSGLSIWPVKSDNVNCIWAIFFDSNRDGIYERGGKFDWGRTSAADRPLHHLLDYKGWDGYPSSGTPWAAVITDVKGKKRSNVATGVWP